MNISTHLIFLLWYLIQTYLPYSIYSIEDVDSNKLVCIEIEEIKIPFKIELLYPLKINNTQQLLVVGEVNNICWLSSANYPNCIQSVLTTHMDSPTAVGEVPDGAFSFPAITITYITGVTVFDISDVPNIKLNHIINTDVESPPIWINDKEFLVYSLSRSNFDLVHFKNVGSTERLEWVKTTIREGTPHGTASLVNIWNSYDALYILEANVLRVMWAEDETGSPGDWQIKEHIQANSIDTGKVDRLELMDLSKGEKMALLLISKSGVTAYEIPRSAHFKDIKRYKMSVMDLGTKIPSDCPYLLKPFVPYVSYNGIPWILAEECEKAFYLKPIELRGDSAILNLNYYRKELRHNKETKAKAFGAVDFDNDGYTNVFIGSGKSIHAFQFQEAPSTIRPTTTTTTTSSKLSLSCMVFVLACFTGSFQMVDMIYA